MPHTRANLADIRIRHLEYIPVYAVEPLRDISCQLQVLSLVLSNRNQIRLIQQNIRRHQRGIGKQSCVDVVRCFAHLSLNCVILFSSPI